MAYLFLLSRILFGGYFFKAGLNHFMGLNGLTMYAQSKGAPMPKLSVIVSGLIVLLGGAGIILGVYTKISVLLIALFLIPVTFIMHSFWKTEDPMAKMGEKINFEKNIALLGGVLAYLFISGAWPFSL